MFLRRFINTQHKIRKAFEQFLNSSQSVANFPKIVGIGMEIFNTRLPEVEVKVKIG